jgi:hypothetical protein
MQPSVKRPLDDAWLRFQRADRHLAEANELVQKFGDACKHYIVTDNNRNPTPTFVLESTPDLPIMLPLIVSDAIHNMRAALDYIVFELARYDSGKVQNGTQFLIEDFKIDPANPKRGFEGRKGDRLKGLSSKHVGMIEALQPYRGVEWTKTIRDISNKDKHRNLPVMSDRGYYRVAYIGRQSLTTKPLVVKPDDWDVDASYAIYIAPPDLTKPGLMPTLQSIESDLGHTLELFQAEF